MTPDNPRLYAALMEYRSWLTTESLFFRRQLGKSDSKATGNTSKNIDFDTGAACAFFSVFNGQRSEREGALPLDGHQNGMTLLKRNDALEISINMAGRSHVLAALNFRVSIVNAPGVRSGVWRKKWVPLAVHKADEGSSTLFLDFDPDENFQGGRVVLEKENVGWTSGIITRSIQAQSLLDYFESLLAHISSGSVVYTEKSGVAFKGAANAGARAS